MNPKQLLKKVAGYSMLPVVVAVLSFGTKQATAQSDVLTLVPPKSTMTLTLGNLTLCRQDQSWQECREFTLPPGKSMRNVGTGGKTSFVPNDGGTLSVDAKHAHIIKWKDPNGGSCDGGVCACVRTPRACIGPKPINLPLGALSDPTRFRIGHTNVTCDKSDDCKIVKQP
jgi:hypothetical protein